MFRLNIHQISKLLSVFAILVLWAWYGGQARSENTKTYVGSERCQECHQEEYSNFKRYAKKAHSFNSVKRMKRVLTDEEFRGCFACHTTGYGEQGGFRSEKETPELKNAGCEVCHGPGSIHAETGEPGDIRGVLTTKDCEICHNPERVEAFNYKPLIFGGAH